MYTDYPTVYETTINQNLIYLIILGVVLFLLLIVVFVSLAKIFKKANRSGISAFIPFYNIFVLLEIVNLPKWYFLLFLIPFVNIIVYISVMFSLAKFFRKSKLFALGLVVLPVVFYPILAFNESEYIGINIVAMEGKSTVIDIPKTVDEEEKNPVVHEEIDEGSQNINISIGGGVYQKDYTNTLLQVDDQQTISNTSKDFIDQSSNIKNRPLNNNIDSSKLSFIAPITEEKEENTEISENDNIEFTNQLEADMQAINLQEQNTTTQESFETIPISPINIISNSANLTEETTKIETSEHPSFTINPEIQALTDQELRQKSEFINCPKCGAKVKSDAKVCFLCGRRLD